MVSRCANSGKKIEPLPPNGGGGGGTTEPPKPTTNEIWNSDKILAELEGKTLQEKQTYGGILHISNAGQQPKNFVVKNGYIQWGGNRTRIYLMNYMIEAGKNKSDLEMQFVANINDNVEKLSLQVGNHEHDSLQFGGYGMVMKNDGSYSSSVEYYHGEADDTSEKEVEGTLPKKIPIGKDVGYRMQIKNDKADKVLNFWIDYDNNGNWIQILKNRRWTNSDWNPGTNMPESDDKKLVEAGVYTGQLTSFWIRNNAVNATKSLIKVKDIALNSL